MTSPSIFEYSPTQANQFSGTSETIYYHEYTPPKPLRTYVSCFWICSTKNPIISPLQERIIPDGCMDIVFDLSAVAHGSKGDIAGIMTVPNIYDVLGYRNFVGVRFLPGMAPLFLDTPAGEFTDSLVELEAVWGNRAMSVAEAVINAETPLDRVALLKEELLSRLPYIDTVDSLVDQALQEIYRRRGMIEIANLAQTLYVSQRQLSRVFRAAIGTSPKRFCRIVRFQGVLNRLTRTKAGLDTLSIALDYDYYDQAHFLKEFKEFYGTTPREIAQR